MDIPLRPSLVSVTLSLLHACHLFSSNKMYKWSCEKINVACPDITKNDEGITGTQIRGLRGRGIHKVSKFLKDHH